MSRSRLISHSDLDRWTTDVLARVRVSSSDARIVAASLIQANLRGIDSHGVMRLPVYVDRIERDLVNPAPQMRIVADSPAFCVLDGDNGLGAVVAAEAVRLAVERSRLHGSAWVAVRSSNHFGAAGHWARMAAEQGMISLVMTNGEAIMAPHNGRAARLGTSPLAIAVPGGPEGTLTLDMGMSGGAWGKIAAAARTGERIPEGWAIDSQGRPTVDPSAALEGIMLPFGGHKGAGLAFMIDLLCGLTPAGLTGTEIGHMYRDLDRPQGVCHLFACIDPARSRDLGEFRDGVTRKADQLAATPAQPGTAVAWPGQRSWRTSKERRVEGIPIPLEVAQDLDRLGERFGAGPLKWRDPGAVKSTMES